MAQIKFRLGPHELAFNSDEPMTKLDVVAMRVVSRDLDVDAPALVAKAMSDARVMGEASIALAYLCAVRRDHGLRWRDFLASIPWDAEPELIADPEPEPVDPPAEPPPAASVAAALAAQPPDPEPSA